MKVLVTGGAGFIGSHYVELALTDRLGGSQVAELTVLDALTYAGRRENLATVEDDPRLTFVHGDIRDSELVNDLVADHDIVINFAAESHVDNSIKNASIFLETNVLGTQVLLDAVLAHQKRMVQVSTDEVYGSIESGSWDEQCPLLPNSPYSASKASADLLARAYHQTYGVDVRITRCSNNYGPRQFPEKVIPLFITNLIDNEKVPLYGDGGNIRDWLHVSDHCRGIHAVACSGTAGEIYNIGGGTELSNLELTKLILQTVGAGDEMIQPVEDRLGHDRRYSVNWAKINAELDYEPKVDFTQGLTETLAWYQEKEAWWRPLKNA